jgi:hypothetical protein
LDSLPALPFWPFLRQNGQILGKNSPKKVKKGVFLESFDGRSEGFLAHPARVDADAATSPETVVQPIPA